MCTHILRLRYVPPEKKKRKQTDAGIEHEHQLIAQEVCTDKVFTLRSHHTLHRKSKSRHHEYEMNLAPVWQVCRLTGMEEERMA